MRQIPKIVQQRLTGHLPASAHPDPDLLTAFAEKALQDRELGQVLEHLSQCADCREVVSLALPEMEGGTIASTADARGWFRWPVLRWGAAAACAAVVAVIGLNLRHQTAPASAPAMASNEVALISRENDTQTMKAEMRAAPKEADEKRSVVSESASRKLAEKPQRLDSDRSQALAGAATSQAVGGTLGPSFPTPAAAPTPATPTAVVAAEQAQIASSMEGAQSDAAHDKLQEQAKKEDLRSESSRSSSGNFARAKDAPEPAAKAAVTSANANLFKQKTRSDAESKLADKVAFIPRWTLSSDGTLQRSLDSGRTWQTIPVASQAVFRAVAALGSEIWVGGGAGVLYHSIDAGDHWTQVKPASGDKSLSADIIGVQFTDTLHGKLTTAPGESWLTEDGGQSWTVAGR